MRSNEAESAVMTQYDSSMPPVDVSHRGRRPMRSTNCANSVDTHRFHTARQPLIALTSTGLVMPTSFRIGER